MTSPAHGDIDAIALQAQALKVFLEDAFSAVRSAERAAEEVEKHVDDELGVRRATLARAEAALAACLAAEVGSCSAEMAEVSRARSRLEAAERAMRMTVQTRTAFDAPKRRFAREADRITHAGLRLLSTMSSDLETYLQSMRAAARTSADLGASAGGVNHGGNGSSGGLPSGWAMIPVASIDDAESPVAGASSFAKGYTPDDLAWAFSALSEVVLPAMALGKGLDYFQERDRTECRVGSRSYTDTYLGFFGDSAIRLDAKDSGRFGVTNGYHRLWVAKRLGLSSIPARVTL